MRIQDREDLFSRLEKGHRDMLQIALREIARLEGELAECRRELAARRAMKPRTLRTKPEVSLQPGG